MFGWVACKKSEGHVTRNGRQLFAERKEKGSKKIRGAKSRWGKIILTKKRRKGALSKQYYKVHFSNIITSSWVGNWL